MVRTHTENTHPPRLCENTHTHTPHARALTHRHTTARARARAHTQTLARPRKFGDASHWDLYALGIILWAVWFRTDPWPRHFSAARIMGLVMRGKR